jgi:hypothetical protein
LDVKWKWKSQARLEEAASTIDEAAKGPYSAHACDHVAILRRGISVVKETNLREVITICGNGTAPYFPQGNRDHRNYRWEFDFILRLPLTSRLPVVGS